MAGGKKVKNKITVIGSLNYDVILKVDRLPYKGEKIGQGRENAKTYLTTHPDIMEEITQTIVKNIEEANNLK